MSNFLKEAFKSLDILNEDAFSLDKVGIEDLKSFLDGDSLNTSVDIIDPEAETEEDVKDSYIGNVVLDCETCHSMIFKKPEEVIINEEDNLANENEECPYCHSISGYKIVGQIGEYCPHCEEEKPEGEETPEVKVEGEEVEIEKTPTEETEEIEGEEEELTESKNLEEARNANVKLTSDKFDRDGDIIIADLELFPAAKVGKNYNVIFEDEDNLKEIFKVVDLDDSKISLEKVEFEEQGITEPKKVKQAPLYDELQDILSGFGTIMKYNPNTKRMESQNRVALYKEVGVDDDGIFVWVEDEEDASKAQKVADHFNLKTKLDEPTKYVKGPNRKFHIFIDPEEEIMVDKGWFLEEKEDLKEEFSKIEIETDTQKMKMESEEDGKVKVEIEPNIKETEEVETEVIQPITPKTKEEIENNSEEVEEPEEEDIDISEFSEKDFDMLGENYLKEVYDNVVSYKTTSGKVNDKDLILEGIITFNSGKKAKTHFSFTGKDVTKDNKLRFLGENLNITKKKGAFILKGSMKGNRFISESLTYNYSGKDAKTGKSKSLYGTVNKH